MGGINCKQCRSKEKKTDNGDGTAGSYQPTCDIVTSKDMQTTSVEAILTSEPLSLVDYTAPVSICKESDVEENQMKQFDFDEDTKVLIIKQEGKISAIGNKCTHYGALLNTGALGKGRIRCPWHGACFNTETGDIEDFPGLDSLPCYNVEIQEDGQVMVRAKRSDLEKNKRIKNMVKRDEKDERTFVVIGGGPAGGVCVETLRQEGFTGRVIMICAEQHLPYDRVKISKSMDVAIEAIQFRNLEFYKEHDIEILLGMAATKLNPQTKQIFCAGRTEPIKYDKVFIATGAKAARPPIKCNHLTNVHTVRDFEDAVAIQKYVDAHPKINVICLGSSFVALEAASYLAKKVLSVTVVGRENVPLKRSFGETIGDRLLLFFQSNGIAMCMSSGIRNICGNADNEITSVCLLDGIQLPCDLLILGTGTELNTKFLQSSGILMNEDGSIDTNNMLQVAAYPDVYVGGDIANAPVVSNNNERAAIGHYQLAQYHGRIAALNMAGTPTQLHAVPFFFTMLFGKGFRYAGYGRFSDVVIEGDLENLKFVAYFLNANDDVIAVGSCGRDPIVAQFAELQSQGKALKRDDVGGHGEHPPEWAKMLLE